MGDERIYDMNKQVIEYAGQPVGIAVPENGKMKFVAVKFAVMELDNRYYPSVVEVKRAVNLHVGGNAMHAA
jgi:hypothetical protein